MVSDALTKRTKRHEGLRLTAYTDSTGNLTVGYGHKLSPDEAHQYETVTLDTALGMLEADLEHAEYACAHSFSFWDKLIPIRQEVLTEMVFQLGMGGVSKFRHMLMALSIEDYISAACQMQASEWRDQTPARCDELATIMRTGDADGSS